MRFCAFWRKFSFFNSSSVNTFWFAVRVLPWRVSLTLSHKLSSDDTKSGAKDFIKKFLVSCSRPFQFLLIFFNCKSHRATVKPESAPLFPKRKASPLILLHFLVLANSITASLLMACKFFSKLFCDFKSILKKLIFLNSVDLLAKFTIYGVRAHLLLDLYCFRIGNKVFSKVSSINFCPPWELYLVALILSQRATLYIDKADFVFKLKFFFGFSSRFVLPVLLLEVDHLRFWRFALSSKPFNDSPRMC